MIKKVMHLINKLQRYGRFLNKPEMVARFAKYVERDTDQKLLLAAY